MTEFTRLSFYLCDPTADEIVECDTLAEAVQVGNKWVAEYRDACDPEWPDGVEDLVVVYGKPDPESDDGLWQQFAAVAKVVAVDRIDRPDTEEEREASGLDWSVDWYCDYRMEVVGDPHAKTA